MPILHDLHRLTAALEGARALFQEAWRSPWGQPKGEVEVGAQMVAPGRVEAQCFFFSFVPHALDGESAHAHLASTQACTDMEARIAVARHATCAALEGLVQAIGAGDMAQQHGVYPAVSCRITRTGHTTYTIGLTPKGQDSCATLGHLDADTDGALIARLALAAADATGWQEGPQWRVAYGHTVRDMGCFDIQAPTPTQALIWAGLLRHAAILSPRYDQPLDIWQRADTPSAADVWAALPSPPPTPEGP